MKKYILALALLGLVAFPANTQACLENENRDSIEILFNEEVTPNLASTFGVLSGENIKCKLNGTDVICGYLSSLNPNYLVMVYEEPVPKSGSSDFALKGGLSIGIKVTPVDNLFEDREVDLEKSKEVLSYEIDWIQEIGAVSGIESESKNLALETIRNGTAGNYNRIIHFNGRFTPYNQTGLPIVDNCGIADAEFFLTELGEINVGKAPSAEEVKNTLSDSDRDEENKSEEKDDEGENNGIPSTVWILLIIAIISGTAAGFYIKKTDVINELKESEKKNDVNKKDKN